jgi:SAM-dependent methyltransferase
MAPQSSGTAFTGTAEAYASYRPAYPAVLLAHLRNAAGTSGSGVLVDLACGPGRVAIPMAAHFRRVLAIDVEPEMVAVGKQRARRAEVANIDWHVLPAEHLTLAPNSVELVTIGEAFHRLDQLRMLELADEWLLPKGCVATLGGESIWSGREPWKAIVVSVSNRWTHITLAEPTTAQWGEPFEIFRTAGWQLTSYQMGVEMIWTTDSIIGFMRSTSFASAHALGDKAAQFEAELRQALLAFAPDDRFPAEQRFGYTLAMR